LLVFIPKCGNSVQVSRRSAVAVRGSCLAVCGPVSIGISDKRAKTVTVLVERRVKHALYGKIVAKSSKYHAHDETGQYGMGDVIEITESKPISKTKNWVATRLVEKAIAI
jgi:small subunit ribosomal protein S17